MADAIVTFSSVFPAADSNHSYAPVPRGSKARTEWLTISTGLDQTAVAAADGEDVVRVFAEADCWVAVGEEPDADSDAAWFIPEGTDLWFSVAKGDHVSVISG